MKTSERVIIYAWSDDIEQLTKYSISKGLQIVKVFEKVRTGDKMQFFEVMDFLKENNIKKVIMQDCSTISRKVSEFLSIMNDFCEAKVNVHFMDNRIDSMLPDGKVNPTFRAACRILNEFDNIRISQTRNRLRNGYTSYIKNGGRIGRRRGSRKNSSQYLSDYSVEISMLRDGVSIRKIHRQTGTSESTLRKLKRLYV